jgi:THO complex subunit 1
VKDNGFDARFILIQEAAQVEEAKPQDLYHSIVESDFKALELAIFGSESAPAAAEAEAGTPADGDVVMADGAPS